MKNILSLLFIITVSCSVQPEGTIRINQDPQVQAQYKEAWLELTKNITEASPYSGIADIWGGGDLKLDFIFDDQGTLRNNFDFDPATYYDLHPLVSQYEKFTNSSFLDKNTAIVFMPNSASPALEGTLYILRISNQTLYRTKSASGFAHINSWDGISIDTNNLVAISTSKTNLENEKDPEIVPLINQDPQIQSQYKEAWLKLTKNITETSPYYGEADIWGGGALKLRFRFDDKGNLWNSDFNPNINQWYILHNLVSQEKNFENSAFLDERTAIVVIPSSASYTLAGTLYVLRLSNQTLYRTKSAWGFDHVKSWDGKSVDTDNLMAIGTPKI
ncbi:MAG: hypothetical protein ACRCWI_06820 [Brevinema sp.]